MIMRSLVYILVFMMIMSSAMAVTITGKVYDSGYPVKGAHVSVNCNGITKEVITLAAGEYHATFGYGECSDGDTVRVRAVKEQKSGETTQAAVCYLFFCKPIDVDIFSQIPEFGLIGSALAGLGGLGYYLKRKKYK